MLDRLIMLDVNGANLSYEIVRRFRRDLQMQFWPNDNGVFAMTPARFHISIEPMYQEVAAMGNVPPPAEFADKTLCGFPIVELEDIPADEIHFRDTDGKLLGKILHIGDAQRGE